MAKIKLEAYGSLFGKANDQAVGKIMDQIDIAKRDINKGTGLGKAKLRQAVLLLSGYEEDAGQAPCSPGIPADITTRPHARKGDNGVAVHVSWSNN